MQQRFQALGKLGAGAYAVVLKAKDAASDQVVALKKLHAIPQSHEELQDLLHEAVILKAACHPNIVRLVDAYQSPSGRVYLVFEHVAKTLARELMFCQGFAIKQVKLVMWQLLQAVAFLHESGILHRDLKPENILLSNEGIVKICDFGFARFAESMQIDGSSYAITRWYRAPEVLIHVSEDMRPSKENDPYSPAVDIWALGCVMASVATGQTLMPGIDRADQLNLIVSMVGPLTAAQSAAVSADAKLSAAFKTPPPGHVGQLEQRLKQLPADAVHVIRECLAVDPQRRATAAQLLRMPFFEDVEVPPVLAQQLQAAEVARCMIAAEAAKPVLSLHSTRSLPSPGPDADALAGSMLSHDSQLWGRQAGSSLISKALSVIPGPASSTCGALPSRGAAAHPDMKARDSASGSGLVAPLPRRPGQAGEGGKLPPGALGARARQLLAASPVYRPLMAEVCAPAIPEIRDTIAAQRPRAPAPAHPFSATCVQSQTHTPLADAADCPLQRCSSVEQSPFSLSCPLKSVGHTASTLLPHKPWAQVQRHSGGIDSTSRPLGRTSRVGSALEIEELLSGLGLGSA